MSANVGPLCFTKTEDQTAQQIPNQEKTLANQKTQRTLTEKTGKRSVASMLQRSKQGLVKDRWRRRFI
jgi:hypothetical protein